MNAPENARAPSDGSPIRPTRVRYQVVAFAVLLAMVTYLDRVCISKLAPDIMRDLDLSKVQMAWVFSSFALAYAFFEIPTAWWADRAGTRRVLTRIVVWWSGFTIATAAAYLLAGLALLIAASSNIPILAAVLISLATAASMFTLGAAWGTCIEVGRDHAGVVSAAMNTSGQIGSLLCPLIVAYSVEWFKSWSLPLYLMGFLFLLGAVCWLIIDPQRPVFEARANPPPSGHSLPE